ncbi:MAG: 4Fe-4S dicluster domain-containing protein [Deltaproteobacteria bacterium]|jgi:ferredoxin|nr:4Fe-4S dicluster domain-containing protein [Deltaproteobacteria bacterium]
MGHLVGKNIYRELGIKIDGMETRVPWNEKLHALLKELYTDEEADLIVKMPYNLSDFDQLLKVTGYHHSALRKHLEGLAEKGLIMDLWVHDRYHYMPSPMIIGIFEFTMMRLGVESDSKVWAKLFKNYLEKDEAFLKANFGHGEQVSFMRALPYEESLTEEEYVEILDYENASQLIEESQKFSIGLCSCRHEKMHLGEKTCNVPLDGCSQFGNAADFMIRHNLAREISKSEMKENFARSKEHGLVLAADNVKKNMKFVCHCCHCCCNILTAISKHGYPNALVTSSYLARIKDDDCVGCGKCAETCPIHVITMQHGDHDKLQKKGRPRIDTSICLGCGVCALQCPTKACQLVKREKSIIHPETTFERVILQSLERGTLQNQIFADPRKLDQKFMRYLVGGFLRIPPVKKALMSDMLRSRFLHAMSKGNARQGRAWVTEM